jgi:hypothetical protein
MVVIFAAMASAKLHCFIVDVCDNGNTNSISFYVNGQLLLALVNKDSLTTNLLVNFNFVEIIINKRSIKNYGVCDYRRMYSLRFL